jgi:hypothetical protein
MKKLWTKICSWFAAIFSRDTVAKVWEIIFGKVKTSIGELLSDPALMNQAFELSKSLVTKDGTASEKAEAFNAQLKAWAIAEGYEIGTAALNAIRETAYAAVKAECESCCDC